MRHVSRFLGAVVLTFAVPLGGLASGQSAKPKAPADPPVVMSPMVLKDFQQRLEHYIKFKEASRKISAQNKSRWTIRRSSTGKKNTRGHDSGEPADRRSRETFLRRLSPPSSVA
jgi:hypothetical protein